MTASVILIIALSVIVLAILAWIIIVTVKMPKSTEKPQPTYLIKPGDISSNIVSSYWPPLNYDTNWANTCNQILWNNKPLIWVYSGTESMQSKKKQRFLPQKKEGIIEKKREAILSTGPKSFYYLDRDRVADLFNQITKDPEPKEIEKTEDATTTKDVSGKIEPKIANLEVGGIKGGYEEGTRVQTKKKYELERNFPKMYNEVEKYLIVESPVTFGAEDFEYDETSFEEIRSLFSKMRDEYEFDIPDDMERKLIFDNLATLGKSKIEELSAVQDFIAVQGEFTVYKVNENQRDLELSHPINQFLPESEKKVHFRISCAEEYLNLGAKSAFEQGSSTKITCLGKIVRWDGDDRNLIITPIAIY